MEIVKDRWAFLHTASIGFAYFLDPKTKAGEGFVENHLYNNSLQLQEFVVIKTYCNNSGCQFRHFVKLFIQYFSSTIFVRHLIGCTVWQKYLASSEDFLTDRSTFHPTFLANSLKWKRMKFL